MQIAVKGLVEAENAGQVLLTSLPTKCPHCHTAIKPVPLFANYVNRLWYVFMHCPNETCHKGFIGYYNGTSQSSQSNFTGYTSIGSSEVKIFLNSIDEVSPDFVKIYNQAYSAEQHNLLEICGVGYRKALEFLIKDYLIHLEPKKKEEFEKLALGECIKKHVKDARVKNMAERAVWLGNDQTHYVKKWEGKTLADLKLLIDLTLYWIQAEIATLSFSDDMPAVGRSV